MLSAFVMFTGLFTASFFFRSLPLDIPPKRKTCTLAPRVAPHAQGAYAFGVDHYQSKRSSKRDRSLTFAPWIRSALATAVQTPWTRMLTLPTGPSVLA